MDACADKMLLQSAMMSLKDDGKEAGFNQRTKELFKQNRHGCPFAKKVSNIILMAGFRQIRGMSIDEAITQLEFNDKKGANIMKEV